MNKVTKKRKEALSTYDNEQFFSIKEASSLIKKISNAKFDATVDMAIRLGVDPKQSNEMVRGVVSLPHGTGKTIKILVICQANKEEEAKSAGADLVGFDEFIEKIKTGWVDFDVIVTSPDCMAKIGPLGKVLGPRGLMPNPKTGTVTFDIGKAVKDIKAGKIDFKVDKFGIIHAGIGKVSFTDVQIEENAKELLAAIIKLKPSSSKGTYVKTIAMSSTMSPSVKIDCRHISN
ncbi:MAG: 50S ribosomal protein L1 [Flavobacteriales bacterium]|jgi:large subunit ribosomal protein L1|nr:50S ribosomal protein L1 [Flavobacteriales bacterium]|tara:strand:- start:487 stop:1182 length:696 start_codon:yes stop_codon:yes gene_type:complete